MAEDEMPGLMAIARGIRQVQAAEGRPHRRLPAHDHPDRGADRNAAGAGRHRALVVVQHLLHPGPCRRGCRRGRRAGVRLEGHERGRVLVVHRADGARPRRLDPEHDPGRRRRPDAADAREIPGDAAGRARRVRGDHHRRAPPARHGARRQAADPGDQRERQRDQVEVRQPLRLPRIAGGRHPPRHRRDDGRQGRRGERLRRCRQRLRRVACATPAAA